MTSKIYAPLTRSIDWNLFYSPTPLFSRIYFFVLASVFVFFTLTLASSQVHSAPLILSNVGSPTVVGTGQGKRAIWFGAGTVNGSAVDIVAVLSTSTLDHTFGTGGSQMQIVSVGQDEHWIDFTIYQAGTYDINTNTGGVPVVAEVHIQINDIDGPNNEEVYVEVCNGTVEWIRVDNNATTFRTFNGGTEVFTLSGDTGYSNQPISGIEISYPTTSTFRFGRTANNGFLVRIASPTYNEADTVDLQCGDFMTAVMVDDLEEQLVGNPVSFNPLDNDSLTTNNTPPVASEWSINNLDLIPPAGATNQVIDSKGQINGFDVPGEGTWLYNDGTGQLTFTPFASFFGAPTPLDYRVLSPDNTGVPIYSPSANVSVDVGVIGLLKSSTFNDENGDGFVQIGETISYTYTVSNEGNLALAGVALSETGFSGSGTTPVPAFQSSSLGSAEGSLAVGETAVYSATYTIVSGDFGNNIDNQATAAAQTPSGSGVSDLSDSQNVSDGNGTGTSGPGTDNDDTTTTSLPSNPVDATDDSGGPANGFSGSTGILNVLDNDLVQGVPATILNTNFTETVPEPNGYLLLNVDGTVDVPADTPAGSYQLTYEICDVAVPANCDTAVASITVTAAPIVASVDDFSGTPVNGIDGGNTATVFTNDTLNGNPFAPADVTPTISADGGLAGVTINPDGTLTVPADTPAGTYTVTYQICEVLNPTNCDTADVTVEVEAGPIVANDDSFTGVDGLDGGNTATVFANDTLNGNPFAPADVTPAVSADGGLAGVTINPDGTLTIPADTPAGTYTVTYQICEVLNPTNCDTADVDIEVNAAPILASVDDFSGTPINGFDGGNTATVFTNDTLNGNPFAPADVTPTISADGGLAGVTINPDGTLTIPADTPAGTYTVTYQICEVLNPTNCDTSIANVTVDEASIVASFDDFSGTLVNGIDGGNTATVFTNDTLNGNPFAPADVTPTISADGGLTGLTINPDGTLTVPADTPAGTYTVTYQICEVLNPTNCDTADVTVEVEAAPIVASVDDFSGTPVNGTGGGSSPTVFINDTLNGNPITPGEVTPTISADGGLAGVTINPDGTLTVPADTPSGTYTVTYQICEVLNQTNCDTADVTVEVEVAPIIANDDDFSGTPNNGVAGGSTPTIFTNDTLDGDLVNPSDVTPTIVSDGGITGLTIQSDGSFSIPAGTPAGAYTTTYQICEILNPANCDTADVMMEIVASSIIANNNDFSGSPINGLDGAITSSVFPNDTLNGIPFASFEVAAIIANDGGLTGVIINLDGTISIPSGTQSGTYTVSYQLCEAADPTNCDVANAAIQVDSALIDAVDNSVTGIDGLNGGSTPTVFSNDTLNGAAFSQTAVTPTIINSGGIIGVSINSDGTVAVPANTPSGSYSVVYQICEVLNPTNCDSATIGIVVDEASLVASDDDFTGTPINGVTGGNTSTVYVNDLINGLAVNPGDITTSIVFDGSLTGVSIDGNGALTVPAGTAAGTYTLTYQICEVLNPANCDNATAMVAVDGPAIAANSDDFSSFPVDGSGGGVTASVFANDILDGNPVDPDDITWTIINDGGLAGVSINAIGNLIVPGGTPAGSYPVTYEICEIFNPSNCDTAIATVVVDPAPIVAETDDLTGVPVNGADGGTTSTVFTNDTLYGAPVTASEITASITSDGGLTGVTINPDGTVTVPPGTSLGTYTLTYQICEILNPANCDVATATVSVSAPSINANNDDFTSAPTNGAAGGNTPTVYGDDTLNGLPLSAADVMGSIVSDGGLTAVSINANGTLSVPAGTLVGTYSVIYQICEVTNPANCDAAVANIEVSASSILAIDDDFSGLPINGLNGGSTGSAFVNDTLSGVPFTPADVSPSIVSTGGLIGVTINPDGTFTAPADTSAGVYTVSYQICENASPTNCDSANVTIAIDAAPISASPNAFSGINGNSGGTTGTVFVNDTLNGVPVSPADVTPTIILDGGLTGVSINPDGTIVIPPGTAAGTYNVTYQICENLNPTNCDTAVVSITVDPPSISAIDDDFTGAPINGATGGMSASILINDTLDGIPVNSSEVTTSIVTDGGLVGVTVNPNGTLSVPANTPAGTYSVTYQICESINPGNCDTAVVAIEIVEPTIDAIPDDLTGSPINGLSGGTTPTVFGNDTLNGNPVNAAEISPSISNDGGLTGVAINPDGTLSIPAGTPSGTYLVTYQICENTNPANCDVAVATVVVDPAPITAIADDFTGTPIDSLTGGNTSTVFINDLLNGSSFSSTDVSVIIIDHGGLSAVAVNSDGTLTVPSVTPAGTYSVIYQICQDLNPANCDNATATLLVEPSLIEANMDNVSGINGASGTADAGNVLTNDTLAGFSVNQPDITISIVTPANPLYPGAPVPLVAPTTGVISVPPGTPSGIYSIDYEICENLNPANCAQTTVLVGVDAPPIDAADDLFTGVNGTDGAANVGNILDNDTINGTPVVVTDVDLSVTNPATPLVAGAPVPAIDPATGIVSVPPDTPAGNYTIDYRICENLNPINCDPATVSITIDPAPIAAVDELYSPVNGVAGNPNTGNVIDNDTLNGDPVDLADITITVVAPSTDPGVVLDPATGIISIAPNTPPGTFAIDYEICQNLNPTNCSSATATIETEPLATVSGTIFNDANGNGVFNPGIDLTVGSNFIVEVADSAGNPINIIDAAGGSVNSVTTDANGDYTFHVPPGSEYRIIFKDPDGSVVGGLSNVTLVAGQNLIDQDLPIDPSGVVFDASTRLPVAGATMIMTTAAGTPLPNICFVAASQQNQVTGTDGFYRFDIVPGADPACPSAQAEYRIRFSVPNDYLQDVSTLLPPGTGPLDATTCPGDMVPGGACQPEAEPNPPSSGPVVYYLSFLLQPGDPNVINNHIPLDPIAEPSILTKVALLTKVQRGQKVPYRISTRDVYLPSVTIMDRMPAGFTFVPGSATVNGSAFAPMVNGREIRFPDIVPDASRIIEINLLLAVTAVISPGRHVNQAYLFNPVDESLLASASAAVEVVEEHVFDCGDIIGKVFDDKNRNGRQNSNEPGLPGVRLASVRGKLVTTDKHGRFHIACADIPDQFIGSNFILKLDTRTLPTGYSVTTRNPRVVRLTRGKTTKFNFGATISRIVRLDLTDAAFQRGSASLKKQWRSGLNQLTGILRSEYSVLRITHRTRGKNKKLTRDRLSKVEALIRQKWKQNSGGYRLEIEKRVLGVRK